MAARKSQEQDNDGARQPDILGLSPPIRLFQFSLHRGDAQNLSGTHQSHQTSKSTGYSSRPVPPFAKRSHAPGKRHRLLPLQGFFFQCMIQHLPQNGCPVRRDWNATMERATTKLKPGGLTLCLELVDVNSNDDTSRDSMTESQKVTIRSIHRILRHLNRLEILHRFYARLVSPWRCG